MVKCRPSVPARDLERVSPGVSLWSQTVREVAWRTVPAMPAAVAAERGGACAEGSEGPGQ